MMTDFRAMTYYPSLLASVKRRVKKGLEIHEAIHATFANYRWCDVAQMGCIDCLIEDLKN